MWLGDLVGVDNGFDRLEERWIKFLVCFSLRPIIAKRQEVPRKRGDIPFGLKLEVGCLEANFAV